MFTSSRPCAYRHPSCPWPYGICQSKALAATPTRRQCMSMSINTIIGISIAFCCGRLSVNSIPHAWPMGAIRELATSVDDRTTSCIESRPSGSSEFRLPRAVDHGPVDVKDCGLVQRVKRVPGARTLSLSLFPAPIQAPLAQRGTIQPPRLRM
ncbi:hypothetical protein LZ30DRAFT_704475 [Colletotrichum cereale]|nr:hypothetical protein LZ30DRAFT_704475 [Colletotrichum cereale]